MNSTNKARSENRYIAYLQCNGVLLFVAELVRRLSSRARALFYRRIFLDKVGSVGGASYIRGLSCIQIDNGFCSGRNLWLEAVVNYNGVKFLPLIQIGKNVKLSNDVHISAINKIIISDDVLIGSRVYIGDHNHGQYLKAEMAISAIPPAKRALISKGEIRIGKNVWISDGVVITGGVSIDEGAVIGANSVVTKDVPRNAIVAGVPGRVIRLYDN
jgi:acetyltransferase-like isoleucine patch superfamily enzyme